MTNYKYIVNLGQNTLKPHFFSRKIAWPVYFWKAIMPTVLTEELDILQKLVLSLAKINQLNDGNVFYQLGISKELIRTAKESCQQQGYLRSNGSLTESGEKLLSNSLNIEKDMLTNFEQIYIFRDGLTGDIIPNFKVTELPGAKSQPCDYIFKGTMNYKSQKPNFVDIGQALKIRKQINRIADTLQQDYASEIVEAEQFSMVDDLDFSVEEVDWELINDDGELEVMNEQEDKGSTLETSNPKGKSTIKIVSHQSDIIYVEANLYIDPDLPERTMVTSPFGENEDDWFTKHMFMYAKKDDKLQEILEFFQEEAKEELIDQYPFNNDLNIRLFERYPIIANYDIWEPLRNQIEATERAYNRLIDGHEDYDTFYMRAQRTLEAVLKYSIDRLPNKQEIMRPVNKYSFTDSIKRIAEELRIEIPSNLFGVDFYRRLKSVARNGGVSSKDRALFLAFDAYYNEQDTPSLQLLRNVPDFYRRINLITNVRNKSTHFSEVEVEETHFYKDIKQELDFLLDSLIVHFLI